MNDSRSRFTAAREVLQRHVDQCLLPGVSAAILKDGVVIERFCAGYADIGRAEKLRADHLHRAFSNTKLVTSTLALMLHDQGHFGLDDPIRKWIPAFGQVRVLRRGAASIDETEALHHDITIRHLLSHQAGLSHGVFDPGTLIYEAIHARGLRRPDTTLAQLMPMVAGLPLLFQPGTDWEYSMATDVLARLIEILTEEDFATALRTRLFEPLGMTDTAHLLRPDQAPRLCTLYKGEDDAQPTLPGLHRLDNVPWPQAHLQPVARASGVSGLVTSEADMLRLLGHLQGDRLLKPATRAEMMRDQLPQHVSVKFPQPGPYPSLGFGLGGAVTRGPSALQPNTPAGEFQWGGLAGTHWSLSPGTGVSIVLMTQRFMGFWNPYWFEYKQAVYQALEGL